MSSSSCSVSNRFLNSSWNSIFFDRYSCGIYSCWPLGHPFCPFHLYVQLMLLITSLWSLPMLTWLMTVTSVTMSGLFVRMWSISVVVRPFGLFHVHLLPAFFWNMVFMISYFLDVAHSTKALSFLSIPAQICPLPFWICSFLYLSIESPITIV